MAKDPICGMTVDEKTAKYKSEYMGGTFYFCCASCKSTFDKNPARYAKGVSGGSK
jgi:YHS domain-containing protein